jgi:hypothetical protein
MGRLESVMRAEWSLLRRMQCSARAALLTLESAAAHAFEQKYVSSCIPGRVPVFGYASACCLACLLMLLTIWSTCTLQRQRLLRRDADECAQRVTDALVRCCSCL